jgi:hypothetical protein
MSGRIVAPLLSLIALGVAVFALTRHDDARPVRSSPRTERVATLEAQVAELQREVETLKAQRRWTPSVAPEPDAESGEADEYAGAPAEHDPQLKKMIDAAVERKADQVRKELSAKANKKPAFDVFASTLKLTPTQKDAAGRVIAAGQQQVYDILNTPTANGTNLMDELVDLVANGFARPGKNQGWGPWFVKVMSEKIPGTDETYGKRIEGVKNEMKALFKRTWTPAQYKEFEDWGVDPTEVEKVPGSSNAELEKRIVQRARELGAQIPAKD